LKDPKKEVKKSYGPVAMREDKKKENELEHQLKAGGEGPEACGKTFNERVQVAALDLQVSRFDQERRERRFLAFKIEADLLQKQIDRVYKIAELDGNYLRYKKLENEMDGIRGAMKQLNAQSADSGLKRCRETIELIAGGGRRTLKTKQPANLISLIDDPVENSTVIELLDMATSGGDQPAASRDNDPIDLDTATSSDDDDESN
jgi:hypothetical protein